MLTATFAVGSPVVGLLENTVPTKTAGLIIGGASALTFVLMEGLGAATAKAAVVLHLMKARDHG